MAFKPKTIRRSPAQLRKYMRAFNDLAKGMRALRKLIESERALDNERRRSVKKRKEEVEEAEDLFKDA